MKSHSVFALLLLPLFVGGCGQSEPETPLMASSEPTKMLVQILPTPSPIPSPLEVNEEDLGKVIEELLHDEYAFRVYYSSERIQFVIWKSGVPVFAEEDFFAFFDEEEKKTRFVAYGMPKGERMFESSTPVLIDLNGDGVQDLSLATYSGGAHCCYHYYIFSLGENFQVLLDLDTQDYSIQAEDLDGDGSFELIGNDAVFNYWNISYADSPGPRFVLHDDGRRYRLDWEEMAKTPVQATYPTDPEVQKRFESIQPSDLADPRWIEKNVPSQLWKSMLDLIYAGRSEEAWRRLNQTWPANAAGKDEFRNAFLEQLKTSPFWEELEPVITLP